MMENDDMDGDMPDWVRDQPSHGSSSLGSTAIRRDNENSRLLKRQSLSRNNNGRGGRESLGNLGPVSPPSLQQPLNEYDDDDIECMGSLFDPVLLWFRAFHTLSLLCGLSCTIVNIYVLSKIMKSKTSNMNDDVGIRDIIIRVYTIICCLLIIITEIDWRYIMHRVRILDLWFFRGFYYAFVGFLSLSDGVNKYGIQPQDICGCIEIGMGFIYVLFGAMCVKSIKLQHLAKYENKNNNVEKNANPISELDFVSV